MKKLKIAVMVDLLLEGGVQKAAIEQVRELNKLGYSAKLLVQIRKKYSSEFSYSLRGVPYQYLSDSYPLIFRKPIKFPIFNFLSTLHLISLVFTPMIIKKGEYDLIVSWGSTTCLTAYTLYKFNRIPYLAIVHDPFVYILDKVYSKTFLRFFFPFIKPVVETLEGIFIKNALKTILISKVHYPYIKRAYDVEPLIIPLGVNLPQKISNLRGDSILSFGRWQREKNPELIIKLAKEFPREKFIIAGTWIDNKEYLWFKSQVKKEKLDKRIKIVPHFDDFQLNKLCEDARLWFHPHFEAFGLAALEAAGHGLPIIIPQRSGVTESFKHGIHGFFPKEVIVGEYKKYVKLLVSDRQLAAKMGSKAREIVKEKFSWHSKVKILLSIIEKELK